MPIIPSLGMQTASQAIQGGMGLLLGRINDRRQYQQEARLQGQQMANERQMIDYNLDKQLEMWKNTSYGAQMHEMIKAGLNPALMYGMGGGGGVTTGQASGHVQTGSAPKGGGEAIGMAMSAPQAAQLALLGAQKENIEADTKVKESQVPKTDAETKSILQDVEKKKLEVELMGKSMKDQLEIINNTYAKGLKEIDILENTRALGTMTREDAVKKLQAEVADTLVSAKLKESNISKNDAEIAKMASDIAQGLTRLSIENKNADANTRQAAIHAYEAEMKAKYPSIGNVMGRILNDLAGAIGSMFGEKSDAYKEIPKK